MSPAVTTVRRRTPRRALATLTTLAAGALVLAAQPAAAHVGTEATTTAAGRTAIVRFTIGHGCDGSPTTEVRVQIPEGVTEVRPEATPGWDIETVTGPITPYRTQDGATVSEGVTEVRWSGGSLPDEQFLQLGLRLRLPDRPGEAIWFPMVQTCEEGEHAWIQIPQEGQPEPDEPAPGIRLTAATGDDHGGGEAAAAGDGDDDGDGTDGLAVAALVVGVLGVVLGGAALVTARRSRS